MEKGSGSRLTLAIALVVVLASCAQEATGPSASASEATDDPLQGGTRPPFGTMPPFDAGRDPLEVPGEIPREVWSAVLDDLSRRLGSPIDDQGVEVVRADAVTWSDGSLGCPQPGQVYTQALVEGHQVVVVVDGETYDYRVPLGGAPHLCERSLPRGG